MRASASATLCLIPLRFAYEIRFMVHDELKEFITKLSLVGEVQFKESIIKII